MNRNELSKEELAYKMLEVQYIKALGRETSWNPEVNKDLYPSNWHSINDYVKKSNILAEAIKNKCLIIDTSEYLDLVEGVKFEKKVKEEGGER